MSCFSHSLIRCDAVRFKLLGDTLVISGQGMELRFWSRGVMSSWVIEVSDDALES